MFDRESFHIVESELYRAHHAALSADIRRLDDILEGVMWALGLGADKFPIVTGRLRRVRTDAFSGAEALRIWFTIDDDRAVELLAIERVDDEDDM
jgi:hypothetical protein